MKKITFIFALLCASVMAFAAPVEGSSTENMAGQGNAFVNGYDYSFSTDGTSVTISFTEKEDYTGLVAYLWNYTSGFAETGMTVSGHTASITLTGQTPGATLTFACKFAYAGGMSVTKQFTYTVEGTGGSTPDPTPAKASECFGSKGHFGNPTVKNVYYQIDYEDNKAIISLISLTGYPLDFAEVQITGVGGYAMTANGAGGYTYTFNNPTANAEWYIRFLYSDTNMPGNEMTAETQNSSDANIIYYKVGECTATTTENANIALSSAGASATASDGNPALAIDGNTGSRWETAASDPQWICVDFGERKKFNTVQLVHEGAYIKTYDIQISDDGTNFTTIKHVSETLEGFPHEQTIELNFDYAAQYLRIYGTERGTGYGYSLWELRAMYSGASVLTSITLTAADTKTLIGGAGVALTATPKDQKGNAMEASVSYEITPAAAGHMSGNTYIPDQVGTASIRAYNGSIYSSAVQVLGVPSANLALSTNISTDNKIIAQSEFEPNGTNPFFAVDGNMGSVWQGSPTNGNVDDSRVYNCWFVVDLGAFYNISLVALHFEGACSELYHIDFSENNVDWNLGYNLVGSEGINARNDYWTALDNNTKVRYVRFWSTKSATGWGMKLFEFEVYGTEWTSGDEEKPVMVSASLVSSTINSAVIAVSATDNDEVARFHVVDATNGIDANFTPSEGKITINGLTHATDYNFTITAKDASNNESANSIIVPVTTPFDGTIDLAIYKTAEAGCSLNEANDASKANDGLNTLWQTGDNADYANQWWYVDLGNTYNIDKITIRFENARSNHFLLQGRTSAPNADQKADDGAWNTLYEVTSEPQGDYALNEYNIAGKVARYVRFKSLSNTYNNQWGCKIRELCVYGSGIAEVDTEKPVMSSASLVSTADSYAVIAVAATDNVGVAKFHVIDAGNSFDANFVAEGGNITVTGLTGGAAYTLVITAIDFFGNESENSKSVAVTTTAHYTAPQAACPAPTWDAALVKAMYSPTYSANYNHQDWGSGTVATEDEFGRKYVTNGNGYFGADGFALNCLLMEKLHYDIWIENDATIRFVPIWSGAEQGITKNLTGQEWNSVDIDLSEYTGITNWGNIYQMKIDYAPNLTFWVANAYFYREAAYEDNEAPTNASASKVAEGFYSVQISAQAEDNSGAVSFKVMNGEEVLATGAAATGVATTITVNNLTPGTNYNFNVVAYDEANNEAEPVVVAAATKFMPAAAPAPDFGNKKVVAVFTDAMACAVSGIQSGGWGETTQVEWLDIAEGDKVFYGQNFNYAGWHSWGGGNIDATDMQYLHVDIYSTGMTAVNVTPISAGHEGSATITLTPNAWTSYDVPLSAYDANNIDWANIFQFKFMGSVGGSELMIDNVYFWSYQVTPNTAQGTDAGGWATFAAPIKLAVPAGLTAYKASYEKTETEEILNLTEISVIPANTGVILKGTAGSDYILTPTDAEASDVSGNVLVGCVTRTDVSAVRATKDIFCMRYSGSYDFTGFFLYEGQYVPANRAYLPLDKVSGPNNAPRKVRFVIKNEQTATGVENVDSDTIEVIKFIENGQLFIRRGEAVYNLQGVRVK